LNIKEKNIEEYYEGLNYRRFLMVLIPCLFLSNLMMPSIFPKIEMQAIGLVSVFFIIYYGTITNYNIFNFILIIYIFSIFDFGGNQAGAFNIISFAIIIAGLAKIRRLSDFPAANRTNNFFVFAFLTFNVLGWIFNEETGFNGILMGMISLPGYLLVFNVTSKIYITRKRLKAFLVICILLLVWMAIVSLNMRFIFIYSKSSLFGNMDSFIGSSRVGSVLDFSASAEYTMVMLILLFPFFVSNLTENELNLNRNWFIIAFLSIFILIALTQMRSNLFLSIVFLVVFFFFVILRKSKGKFNLTRFYGSLSILLLFFVLLSSTLRTEDFLRRLSEVNIDNLDYESVTSGKGINRGTITLISLARIAERPWILGFGWGNLNGNRTAWFGPVFRDYIDPHNLYYSIIPVFGWTGSLFFILLIVNTIKNIIIVNLKRKNKESNYLTILSYSFIFAFVFFLINQFKATIITYPHYFMIFWIWLGLANATVRTIEAQEEDKKNSRDESSLAL
jgi:hypothetical protein